VDTFSNLSFWNLFFKGVVHSIWIVALYIAVNFIFNKSAFRAAFELYRSKNNQ
jgi:hypothetical protein